MKRRNLIFALVAIVLSASHYDVLAQTFDSNTHFPQSGYVPDQTIDSYYPSQYYSSHSPLASDVYEPWQTAAPSEHRSQVIRRENTGGGKPTGGGGQETTNDPKNPQFGPIGDGIWVMIACSIAAAVYVFLRRRRTLISCKS